MSDAEFIYLHSMRFDKFFRMSCSLDWTADQAIEYLTKTLALPWNVELSAVGMAWRFTYGLRLNGKGISLNATLREAGAQIGSVVRIRINGTNEDLYQKELKESFSADKFFLETLDRRLREEWLREQVAARRNLTGDELKAMADSCFAHV